jgi:hypothetical protein
MNAGRLAARGESPAAFGRRCIPAPPHRAEKRAAGTPVADCVAPPSNIPDIPDILGRCALSSGRLAALGATLDFHHGLLILFMALAGLVPLVPSAFRANATQDVSTREISLTITEGTSMAAAFCRAAGGSIAIDLIAKSGITVTPTIGIEGGFLAREMGDRDLLVDPLLALFPESVMTLLSGLASMPPSRS